jgi:eukaryotic-like serine/threonine-protein kinase
MDPEPSWGWAPGQELASGLLAWALLGDGRRCETWLAWDLGRWCPVAVKLPRPVRTGRRRPRPGGAGRRADRPPGDPAAARDPPRPAPAGPGLRVRRGPNPRRLRDGRPVLIDLGLARPVGEPPAGGQRRGSPPWMSPEQVRRRPASPGMDLFALGAVLYELATGTRAFDPADDGPPRRRWPQLTGPPPVASSRNSEVPASLDRAVAALLAPDPGGPPGHRRPGARPAGGGHAGRRRRGGPAVAHLGYRAPPRLASLHHGASPARSTTCVGIAGGPEMLLARVVARGKTPGRSGTGTGAGPRGGQGGPRAGHALTRRRAPTGALNPAAEPCPSEW